MNYNNIILPELSLEESQIKKKPHVHIACVSSRLYENEKKKKIYRKLTHANFFFL